MGCRRAWRSVALVLLLLLGRRLDAGFWQQTSSAAIDGFTANDDRDGDDRLDWGGTVQPRWTLRAGAVFLHRSAPGAQAIFVSDTGQTLLDANQFRFGGNGGPDVTVTCYGQDSDLEVRYFGIGQWCSQPTPFVATNAELQFNPPITLDNTSAITAAYYTALQSVEMNLRRNIRPRIGVLAGFRYVSLRERLEFVFQRQDEPRPPIHAAIGGMNDLFGSQIGVDAIVWYRGPLRIEGAAKAGLYGNDGRNSLIARQQGDTDVYAVAQRMAIAFVGDINAAGVYRLTDRWSARLGYQLLWISGVALASEQLSMISPDREGITGVNTGGSPFYHGAMAGLECAW